MANHLLRVSVALLLLAGVASAQTAQEVAALRQQAQAGDAYAQFFLGLSYANGKGVPQDDTQAVAWYRKAADQGNAAAQFNLGVMYQDGQGVPKDDTQSVAWFRKAANQGYGAAQHYLGVNYAYGTGVPQDDVLAYMWLNLAASRNSEKGNGFVRDLVAARLTPQQRADGQRMAREWQVAFEKRKKK